MLTLLTIAVDSVAHTKADPSMVASAWEKTSIDLIALIVGIGTVIILLITLIFKAGRAVERLESVEKKVGTFESRLEQAIRGGLIITRSPMQLSDQGIKVMHDSGINNVVDSLFTSIVEKVRALSPPNAYQAQQHIINIVQELKQDEQCRLKLEDGAFRSGHSVDDVLFVGAIYIRDRVLKELGLQIDDIDKHDPRTPTI